MTRTRIQCIAFSPCADGSEECKTCDELLVLCKAIAAEDSSSSDRCRPDIRRKTIQIVCVWACARVLLLAGSACHADDCMMIACFADSMHAVIVSDEHVMCIKCPDPL